MGISFPLVTLQVWIEYVPVKELRQMSLDFPLPDLTEHYASDVRKESRVQPMICALSIPPLCAV